MTEEYGKYKIPGEEDGCQVFEWRQIGDRLRRRHLGPFLVKSEWSKYAEVNRLYNSFTNTFDLCREYDSGMEEDGMDVNIELDIDAPLDIEEQAGAAMITADLQAMHNANNIEFTEAAVRAELEANLEQARATCVTSEHELYWHYGIDCQGVVGS